MKSRAQLLTGRLRRLVREGYFEAGNLLPTLDRLSTMFRVSRMTVQAAVHNLQHEGLVDAVRGRGVFVRPPVPCRLSGARIGLLSKYPVERLRGAGYPRMVITALESGLSGHGGPLELLSLRDIGISDIRGCLAEKQLGGLVLLEVDYPPLIEDIKDTMLPLVSVDFDLFRQGISSAAFDNLQAGFTVTRALSVQGHRRIAFVRTAWEREFYRSVLGRSVTLDPVEDDRLRGYALALLETGAAPLEIAAAPEKLGEEIRQMCARRDAPTALVCMDAETGCRAVAELEALGYRVPADISIAVFAEDRVEFAPGRALAAATLDSERIGREAVRLLMALGDDPRPQRVLLPVPFARHDSLAAASHQEN